MTFEEMWAEHGNLAWSIANEYGRTNHRYGAEADDFAQELAIWVDQNLEDHEDDDGKTVPGLLTRRDEMGEAFGRYLAKCLRNQCNDYAIDIKAQALGYERRDVYFYSPGELKVLLDAVFDEESWGNPPQSDGRSPKTPAEGNNWISTLADVAGAFKKLSQTDQELLRDFHERGWRNSELAEVKGVSEATMSYRHGAAVNRLLKKLGGPAPRPMRTSETDPAWRGRRAVSNSTARAVQDNYYQET